MYQSTKVIDGFSTVFRQHKANSHCSKLHGYALKFKVVFQSLDLDSNNWVMDFGFLKDKDFLFDNHYLVDWFKYMFDHTTVVSSEDPNLHLFLEMAKNSVMDLRIVDRIGCEAFAELVYSVLNIYCKQNKKGKVILYSVECIENEKNSAIYYGKQ